MEKINVSEAKSRFSELISRASAGERFIIQRRDKPIAALINVETLEKIDRSLETTQRIAKALGQSDDILQKIKAGKLHPAMAAFGLWKDEQDLASLSREIRKNRDKTSQTREVRW